LGDLGVKNTREGFKSPLGDLGVNKNKVEALKSPLGDLGVKKNKGTKVSWKDEILLKPPV
jgi:hypothetical protein